MCGRVGRPPLPGERTSKDRPRASVSCNVRFSSAAGRGTRLILARNESAWPGLSDGVTSHSLSKLESSSFSTRPFTLDCCLRPAAEGTCERRQRHGGGRAKRHRGVSVKRHALKAPVAHDTLQSTSGTRCSAKHQWHTILCKAPVAHDTLQGTSGTRYSAKQT
jgi:hypothetical protein